MVSRAAGLTVVACLAFASGGCRDHRISLNEFLELQDRMRVEGNPPVAQAEAPATFDWLDAQLGPYRVGPSDVLRVTIILPDGSMMFSPVQARVDRTGELDLPVIGGLKVADMELEDIEAAIKSAYVPNVVRDAVVYVELAHADSVNVLVDGAVTFPGLIQLRRTERNLLFTLVAAGGISSIASGEATLKRLRHPGREEVYDLNDPEGLRAALAAPPLENGDIVLVHAAMPNTVFVGGLVNAPRPQAFAPGVEMTALQALAASGGLRTDVFPKEATLIRRMPDGTDVHVKLDLDRMQKGEDPNIMMAAGDIFWVPETAATRMQDWINRNIFLRAGATATVSYNVNGVEYMNRRSQQSNFGRQSGDLEDSFDPFGFLTRNAALQNLQTAPPQ
jgi:polysaccharide export outer membrane protein